ncbi:hypothetical protein [Undibacterium sp. TJN19]|uniref:hypothetical protein n=1 Tax=Undibacterium sp. TJN19 TaxID=3413055 RepID=UPI003BF3F4E7
MTQQNNIGFAVFVNFCEIDDDPVTDIHGRKEENKPICTRDRPCELRTSPAHQLSRHQVSKYAGFFTSTNRQAALLS